MKTTFLCAGALIALAACSPERPAPPVDTEASQAAPAAEPAPPPIPQDSAAGPSGRDNMTWIFDRTGEGRLRLMYSARGSSEMAINIQCDSERIVHITVLRSDTDVAPEGGWPFTLISGETRAPLAGVTSGESSGDVFVMASTGLGVPVMRAFRESGQLIMRAEGQPTEMHAINDEERAAIEGFFAACEVY